MSSVQSQTHFYISCRLNGLLFFFLLPLSSYVQSGNAVYVHHHLTVHVSGTMQKSPKLLYNEILQ